MDGMSDATDETNATPEDLSQWWAEREPVEVLRRPPFERKILSAGLGEVSVTAIYGVATWNLLQAPREPTAQIAPREPATAQ